MTTDRQLIAAVEKLIGSAKLVTAAEKALIEELLAGYERACRISRGPDKQREAHWANIAFERGQKLQRWFQAITGRPWVDMSGVPKARKK